MAYNEDDFDDSYGYERSDAPIYKDEYYRGVEGTGSSGGLAEQDAADKWLQEQDNKKFAQKNEVSNDIYATESEISNLDITGKNEQAGFAGVTPRTLQMNRFKSMSVNLQQNVVNLLQEPALYGALNINESMGISSESTVNAVNSFGSVIGSDPLSFAKELSRGIPEGTMASTHRVDVKTAYSMVGLTAEAKLEAGPGSSLTGSSFTEDQRLKKDQDLAKATGLLNTYAELYIPQEAKQSSIYGRRQAEVRDALVNSIIGTPNEATKVYNFKSGAQAQDVEGNDIYANSRIPLPNELDIRGLIPTASDSGYMGSPHTRLSFAAMFPTSQDLFIDSENRAGWKPEVWESSQAGRLGEQALYASSPNARKSFFPEKKLGREGSQELYGQMKDDFKFMERVFRSEAITTSDENNENYLRAKNQNIAIDDVQSKLTDAYNEASILDLELAKYSSTGMTTAEAKFIAKTSNIKTIGQRGQGSDRGGMYGNIGISERDLFLEQKLESQEADISPSLNVQPDTDRSRYLEEVRLADAPKQGSDEWLEQRKGNITASTVGKLLKPHVQGGGAIGLAPSINDDVGLLDNFYMHRGRKGEAFVKGMFEKVSGLTSEEAFFTKNPKLPGYGVTPDGVVFDNTGKSMGISEFKYVSSNKNLESSMKDYENQLQLQMAVTGETEAHFFRVNASTEEYMYDVVKADTQLQSKLITQGNIALKIANGEEVDVKEYKTSSQRDKEASSNKATVYNKGTKKTEQKATVYQGRSSATPSTRSASGTSSIIAPTPTDAFGTDAHERLTDMILKESGISVNTRGMDKEEAAMTKSAAVSNNAKALSRFNEEKKSIGADSTSADKEAANAAKEKADADKEAARSSKEFSNKVLQAAAALGDFAALGKQGIDTQMDDVRLAAKIGMETDEVRSMRFQLEADGGLSSTESSSVLQKAANLATTFNDPLQGVGTYVKMESSLQAAGLGSMGSFSKMQQMKPAEMAAFHQDRMNGFSSAEERATYGRITGMSEFAISANKVSGDDLLNIKDTIDEEGARDAYKGYTDLSQVTQVAKETGANLVGGTVIKAAEVASDVAGMAKNTVALGLLTTAVAANTVAQFKGLAGSTSKAGAAEVLKKVAGAGAALGTGAILAGAAVTGAAVAGIGAGLTAAAGSHYSSVNDEIKAEQERQVQSGSYQESPFAKWQEERDANSKKETLKDTVKDVKGTSTTYDTNMKAGYDGYIKSTGSKESFDDWKGQFDMSPQLSPSRELDIKAPSDKEATPINNIEVNNTITKDGATTEVLVNGKVAAFNQDNTTDTGNA